MGKDSKELECWEKEDRCGDCPADHPENECNKFETNLG